MYSNLAETLNTKRYWNLYISLALSPKSIKSFMMKWTGPCWMTMTLLCLVVRRLIYSILELAFRYVSTLEFLFLHFIVRLWWVLNWQRAFWGFNCLSATYSVDLPHISRLFRVKRTHNLVGTVITADLKFKPYFLIVLFIAILAVMFLWNKIFIRKHSKAELMSDDKLRFAHFNGGGPDVGVFRWGCRVRRRFSMLCRSSGQIR